MPAFGESMFVEVESNGPPANLDGKEFLSSVTLTSELL
jgi:hypothetical protein